MTTTCEKSKKRNVFNWRRLVSGMFLCFVLGLPISVFAQLPAKKPLGKKTELPAKKPLGSNSSTPTGNGDSSISDAVVKGLNDFGNIAKEYQHSETDGYPCVQLQLGASHNYGEFARLKCCLGGLAGYMLYGGIGKEMIFDGINKDELLWHAGMGYFANTGDGQDFTWSMNYANSPQARKGSLNMEFGYSWFFGDKQLYGVFAGAGFGITEHDTNKERAKFLWNIEVGFAVKLWQKYY